MLPRGCALEASGATSRLRVSATRHPTVLHHMVVSLCQSDVGLLLSMEAEPWIERHRRRTLPECSIWRQPAGEELPLSTGPTSPRKTYGCVSGSVTTIGASQIWSYHSIARAAHRLYPCTTSDDSSYVNKRAVSAGSAATCWRALRARTPRAPRAAAAGSPSCPAPRHSAPSPAPHAPPEPPARDTGPALCRRALWCTGLEDLGQAGRQDTAPRIAHLQHHLVRGALAGHGDRAALGQGIDR